MLLSSEMFVGLLGKETSFPSRLRAKETFWGTIPHWWGPVPFALRCMLTNAYYLGAH